MRKLPLSPVPAKKQKKRGKFLKSSLALILWFVFVFIASILDSKGWEIGFLEPIRALGDSPIKAGIFFVGFLYLAIVIHELGHLAAAKILGFKFYELCIGPISIRDSEKGFKFELAFRNMAAGFCRAFPTPDQKVSKLGLAFYFANGNIFNITFGIICLTIDSLLLESAFFSGLGYTNFLIAVINSIPMKAGGLKTDATVIKTLITDSQAAQRDLATMVIASQMVNGVRIEDMPRELWDQFRELEGEFDFQRIYMTFLRYRFIEKNEEKAEDAIAYLYEERSQLKVFFRIIVQLVAARYVSFRKDVLVDVDSWVDGRKIPERFSYIALTIEVRNALLKDDLPEASRQLAEARRIFNKYFKGQDPQELELMNKLEVELSAQQKSN